MIEFFGADGWPVERFIGRPVTNFIRLCLHTRGVRLTLGRVPPVVTHALSLGPNEQLMEPHLIQARERLRRMFRGAHYVDLLVRRNGKDEKHQGDWLKVFFTAPTAGVQSANVTVEATAHSAATRRTEQGGLAPDPQTLIARKEAAPVDETPRGVEEPARCATIDVDGILHTCELTPGHDGDHVCRAGDWEWK